MSKYHLTRSERRHIDGYYDYAANTRWERLAEMLSFEIAQEALIRIVVHEEDITFCELLKGCCPRCVAIARKMGIIKEDDNGSGH